MPDALRHPFFVVVSDKTSSLDAADDILRCQTSKLCSTDLPLGSSDWCWLMTIYLSVLSRSDEDIGWNGPEMMTFDCAEFKKFISSPDYLLCCAKSESVLKDYESHFYLLFDILLPVHFCELFCNYQCNCTILKWYSLENLGGQKGFSRLQSLFSPLILAQHFWCFHRRGLRIIFH